MLKEIENGTSFYRVRKLIYENDTELLQDITALASRVTDLESAPPVLPTGSEIKDLLFAESDTNNYDDAAVSKLGNIETGATADQTGNEIKQALFAESNVNNYTDYEKDKLDNLIQPLAEDYVIEFGSYGFNHSSHVGQKIIQQYTDYNGIFDGTINPNDVEAGDYWYVINTTDTAGILHAGSFGTALFLDGDSTKDIKDSTLDIKPYTGYKLIVSGGEFNKALYVLPYSAPKSVDATVLDNMEQTYALISPYVMYVEDNLWIEGVDDEHVVVLGSVHNKGLHPRVLAYTQNGTEYTRLACDYTYDSANGDMTIEVKQADRGNAICRLVITGSE